MIEKLFHGFFSIYIEIIDGSINNFSQPYSVKRNKPNSTILVEKMGDRPPKLLKTPVAPNNSVPTPASY